jgi:hypothetical protein
MSSLAPSLLPLTSPSAVADFAKALPIAQATLLLLEMHRHDSLERFE